MSVGTMYDDLKNRDLEENVIKEFCENICKEIISKRTLLVNVVKNLEPLLTSADISLRKRGTWVLTEIVKNLPSNLLTEHEIDVIVTFFCDRLKDYHDILPTVLEGIHSIVDMTLEEPQKFAVKIVSSIFSNVVCQQLTQYDRHKVYYIVSSLLSKNLIELLQMGEKLPFGVINAIDGERDPRNLLFLFRWLPNFLTSVPIHNLTEDMFDVIGCYFPIDFQASPSDDRIITRNDLAESLCQCLCVLPEFAEFCIPLLLEKLDSNLEVAKMDSLKLLEASCKTFSVNDFAPYILPITRSLKQIVIFSKDDDLINCAVRAMTAFVKLLSTGKDTEKILYFECLNFLIDNKNSGYQFDSDLFEKENIIFTNISKTSENSCRFIIEHILPTLINQYLIIENPTYRAQILQCIVGCATEWKNHHKELSDCPEVSDIFQYCLDATKHDNLELKVAGFKGINSLASCLTDSLREHVYDMLLEIVINEANTTLRSVVIDCLKTLGESFPIEVQNKIIRSDYFSSKDCKTLRFFLEAICNLVSIEHFSDEIIEKCSTFCFVSDENITEIKLNFCRQIIENNLENTEIRKLFVKHECGTKFLHLLKNYLDSKEAIPEKILIDSAFILKSFMGCQVDQQKILNDETENILNAYLNNSNSSVQQIIFITLLDGLLSRVQVDVAIPVKWDIVTHTIKIALRSNSNVCHWFASRLLANLVNKCSDDNEVTNILDKLENEMSEAMLKNAVTMYNHTGVISWVTKALFMRGFPNSESWLDKMIALLEKTPDATKGFELIMQEDCESLCENSFCKIRFLYRQKIFTLCCNKLTAEKNYQTEYLIALSFLLKSVPYMLLVMHFPKIRKQLCACLALTDKFAVEIVLEKFCEMLKQEETILNDCTQDLIPAFIKLSRFEDSMNVRIAALNCLRYYTKYKLHLIVPYKNKVTFALASCLDDRKRLVRKAAVNARSAWFLIGGS